MDKKFFLTKIQSFDRSSDRVLEVEDKVQFTEEYLNQAPETKARYSGRIGVVTGFRAGASDPTVVFPKVGRKKEQKLFEIHSFRLKKVIA